MIVIIFDDLVVKICTWKNNNNGWYIIMSFLTVVWMSSLFVIALDNLESNFSIFRSCAKQKNRYI